MKFSIIIGSHREKSESAKVAHYLEERLKDLKLCDQIYTLDLGGNPLPLWDESVWKNGEKWQEKWNPVAKELQESDAVILISPEWAGMVPAGLKNFLLLCSTKELGHKPALITSVSAGINGAYPISELRMSGYKNNKVCFLPEHLIVRNVASILEDDQPKDEHEENLRERIDFDLNILHAYAKALKPVRESGVTQNEKFPFGM